MTLNPLQTLHDTVTLMRAIVVALLLVSAIVTTNAAPPSGLVTLGWGYPSNSVSDDMSFVVVATNQLGSLPWTPVANPMASNCVVGYDGSNLLQYRAQFTIQPGQMFFSCYASNFWGLSMTSNIVSTPPLPIPVGQMSITRTN